MRRKLRRHEVIQHGRRPKTGSSLGSLTIHRNIIHGPQAPEANIRRGSYQTKELEVWGHFGFRGLILKYTCERDPSPSPSSSSSCRPTWGTETVGQHGAQETQETQGPRWGQVQLRGPRQGQEEAKKAPRTAKRAKMKPKWGQDEAKRSQNGAKMGPREARRSQDEPKIRPEGGSGATPKNLEQCAHTET